jgi:hypothetical protein
MKLYNLLIILFFTPYLHAAVATGSLTPSRDGQTDQSTQPKAKAVPNLYREILNAIKEHDLEALKRYGIDLTTPSCSTSITHMITNQEDLQIVIDKAPKLLTVPNQLGEICLHVFAQQNDLNLEKSCLFLFVNHYKTYPNFNELINTRTSSNFKESALYLAIIHHKLNNARLLHEHGVLLSQWEINQLHKNEKTLFKWHPMILKLINSNQEQLRLQKQQEQLQQSKPQSNTPVSQNRESGVQPAPQPTTSLTLNNQSPSITTQPAPSIDGSLTMAQIAQIDQQNFSALITPRPDIGRTLLHMIAASNDSDPETVSSLNFLLDLFATKKTLSDQLNFRTITPKSKNFITTTEPNSTALMIAIINNRATHARILRDRGTIFTEEDMRTIDSHTSRHPQPPADITILLEQIRESINSRLPAKTLDHTPTPVFQQPPPHQPTTDDNFEELQRLQETLKTLLQKD